MNGGGSLLFYHQHHIIENIDILLEHSMMIKEGRLFMKSISIFRLVPKGKMKKKKIVCEEI